MKFRLLLAIVMFAACGSSTSAMSSDATSSYDASTADGSAMRQPCTSSFGHGLPSQATFGRLDGYLVAVVSPANMQACNDDNSHVHLQVRMDGSIYDIAIDVTDEATMMDDVHTTTRDDLAMPGTTPWSEGWHDSSDLLVDYVTLGLRDTDIGFEAKADLVQTLQTDLAGANHISVYTTSYGPDGAHLVHRNGNGHDGLVVTNPAHPHLQLQRSVVLASQV